MFIVCCMLIGLLDDSPKKPDVKKPELREELLARTIRDQKARMAMIEKTKALAAAGKGERDKQSPEEKAKLAKLLHEMQQADAENTTWLKGIVAKQGWPTITDIGKDGFNAAWLLVQHADADRPFQKQCLELMEKLPRNEVIPSNVAYLTDRVLVADGKKQKYGTQFTQVDGKHQPQPIEDEANVDKRRKELGLSTMAEYTRQIEKMYGSKK
jgi:hypothetical protein